MQTMSLPKLDGRYWATLALASVFGTNTGDVLSHSWHLGDYGGLPVLAGLFAMILLAERRVTSDRVPYYWLAIIVLRTAATNLADLSTLQWELGYEAVILALLVLLALTLTVSGLVRLGRHPADGARLTTTNGVYWFAMLAAATLGTALGDYGSHTLTLRLSAVITVAMLAMSFWLARGRASSTAAYWCAIVLARTAGTNVGDLIAFRKGLNLGLPASTLVTGLLFFAVVVLARRREAVVQPA